MKGGGAEHLGCLVFSIPVPLHTQCFFNLLTSICTYKQCLQRNTFTGVDWLVHNNPYLEWHGKLTVVSHTNNVSDPSYYKVHWPEHGEWFNNPFKMPSFSSRRAKFHASFMILHQQHNTISCGQRQSDWGVLKTTQHNMEAAEMMSYPNIKAFISTVVRFTGVLSAHLP